MHRGAVWLGLLLAAGPVDAVTVSPLFSDHAVLQTGVPVPIWGRAAPGERVTVALGRRKPVAVAASGDGRWQAVLPPLKPVSVGEDLVIQGEATITIHDVVVGEVWLCGGQSNMDFRMAKVDGAAKELAAANRPQLRQLLVARNPQSRVTEDLSCHWSVCSPATAAEFTAVGYYFGRKLESALQAPVGLISSSYGNTPIEAWMSAAALDRARGARLALTAAAEPYQAPSVLFNGMIYPLLPYALKGVLWYQGESNAGRAEAYPQLLALLANDWRHSLGQGEIPFFWVQLPNLRSNFPNRTTGADWVALREAQAAALPLVANSGLVVTLDGADAESIHPGQKRAIGERLALLALRRTYGRNVEADGPSPVRVSRVGTSVRLSFRSAAGGLRLQIRPNGAGAFELAGSDGDYRPCTSAAVHSDVLVLGSAQVLQPASVRYAHQSDPTALLYNQAGLPAGPFTLKVSSP